MMAQILHFRWIIVAVCSEDVVYDSLLFPGRE